MSGHKHWALWLIIAVLVIYDGWDFFRGKA